MSQKKISSFFLRDNDTKKENENPKSLGNKSFSVFTKLESNTRPIIKRRLDDDESGKLSEPSSEIERKPKVLKQEEEVNNDKDDSTPPTNFEEEPKESKTEEFTISKEIAIEVALQKKNQMSRALSTPLPLPKKSLDSDTDEDIFSDAEDDDDSDNNNNNNNNSDKSRSKLVYEHTTEKGIKVQVRHGDLCYEDVDAIVNAANEYLAHGGGVAGAISRTGGPAIQRESNQWVKKYGEVPTGDVAVTGPGNLICKCVIHAVGPVWHGGKSKERELLRDSVLNSLKKATELKLESIAFCAISSGIFGFPKPLCAKIMFAVVLDYVKDNETTLKVIRFTNFDTPTVSVFSEEFEELFDKKG